jgi:hypothetical protein
VQSHSDSALKLSLFHQPHSRGLGCHRFRDLEDCCRTGVMASLPVVERRAGNGRCKSKTLVGIDVYYDIRRFSRPALVICVQPVQSFQALILNGDRVVSLFSNAETPA